MPIVLDQPEAFVRRKREDQDEVLAWLTVIDDEDASLRREFGTRVMVTGRIARVIEEAECQGGLLDFPRLRTLFPVSVEAIRYRLESLWSQGTRLFLAGLSQKTREHLHTPRPVLAIRRYLDGEPLRDVRKDLCLSSMRWRTWWNTFQLVHAQSGKTAVEVAEQLQLPLRWIEGWQEIIRELNDKPNALKLLSGHAGGEPIQLDTLQSPADFQALLRQRHGYSPMQQKTSPWRWPRSLRSMVKRNEAQVRLPILVFPVLNVLVRA